MHNFDPLDYLSVAVAERQLSRGEISKAEFEAVIDREQKAWQHLEEARRKIAGQQVA